MATIITGLSTHHRPSFAEAAYWSYIANGYDPMYAHDGKLASGLPAGIAAPSTAPVCSTGASGGVTAGIHFLRYRYRDKSTGYVGEPTSQTSHDAPGSKKIDATKAASSDARIDQVILEMTLAGGTVFYEAGIFDNDSATAAVDISDTALGEGALRYPDDGHERPPIGRLAVYHRGYMFVGGPEEHAVGAASCVGSTAAVTFSGADIRDALEGGYFIREGGTDSYEISSVDSTGDAGKVTLARTHSAAFSGQAYQIIPVDRSRVYYSDALYPEGFNLTDRYFNVLKKSSGTLRAIVPFRNSQLYFGHYSFEIHEWGVDPGDPDDARLFQVSNTRGALSQEVVVVYDDVVYAMDFAGIYRWSGGKPDPISHRIKNVLGGVDFSQWKEFHATVNPITDEVIFFVCYGAETEPQTALIYNIRRNRWYTGYYDRAITSSDVMPDSKFVLRPAFGTVDGALWYAGIGYSDGVYPGTTMKGTVGSGSTKTTVEIGEGGMYATGAKLKGVGAYWVEGNELKPISDNAAAQLTIGDGGYSTAPSTADTILLGRIVSKLKSKRYRLSPPSHMQKEATLIVDFSVLPSAKVLKLEVFIDGSGSAKSDWDANTDIPGVTFVDSDSEILIDLSTAGGTVEIPLGDIWHRLIEFEFTVDEPNIPLQLIRYYIVTEIEESVKE